VLSLCTSEYARRGLGDGIPAAVIHPPVTPPSPEIAQGRAALRAALDVTDLDTVIIQVGRMEWLKGHEVLLRALGNMRDHPGWTAWIVGGAQRDSERRYLGRLAVLAAQLGIAPRVRFLGERADVGALLAAADIACQPNVAPEAFGITQVEAMYAGLPVVSSDAGGAPEVIDHTCGMLVPPGDVEALGAALLPLVEERSLRTRLGAAGPARARMLSEPGQQIARLAAAVTSVLHGATLGT
jgi:glycosyltransferase involved in cell wall biosynthesis